MKDQFDALKLYCKLYLSANVEIKEENNIEANLIIIYFYFKKFKRGQKKRSRDISSVYQRK